NQESDAEGEGAGETGGEDDPLAPRHAGAASSGHPVVTNPARPGRVVFTIGRTGIASWWARASRASSERSGNETPSASQSSRMPSKRAAFERPSSSVWMVWTCVPLAAFRKYARWSSSEESSGHASVSSSVGSVVGTSSVRKTRPPASGKKNDPPRVSDAKR